MSAMLKCIQKVDEYNSKKHEKFITTAYFVAQKWQKEMDTPIDVSLSSISTIISAVQRVVARFYGPQCSQTLLTSQTGKAVVTSDGFTILESLHPDHPVASLVSKSLRSCHSHTMDGAKTFLLYLAFIIQELDKAIEMGSFGLNGTFMNGNRQCLQRQGTISAQKYLLWFRYHILPTAVLKMLGHSEQLVTSLLKNKTDLLLNVCRTTLAPHFNPKLCRLLAGLLEEFVTESHDNNIQMAYLQLLVDKFQCLSVKVPNRPYSDCTFVDTVLIQRDFSVYDKHLLSMKSMNALVSLNFDNNSDRSNGSSNEVFRMSAGNYITDSLLTRHKAVEGFVKKCVSRNISVYICSKNVPSYALNIFKQHNVSVIANVLDDDIDILMLATGKTAMESISEEFSEFNVISLSGVQQMIIGGHRYVHLKIEDSLRLKKHMIICAPSIGLCDQLAQMLQKALNAMLLCFDLDSLCESFQASCKLAEPPLPSSHHSLKIENGQTKDIPELNQSTEMINNSMNKDYESKKLKTVMEPDCFKLAASEEDKGNLRDKSDEEFDYANKSYMTLNPCDKPDVKSAKVCNTDSSRKLYIIEGGGSFELLLSKHLFDCASDLQNAGEKAMCTAVSEAIIRVVGVLYENVTETRNGKRAFLEVRTKLLKNCSNGRLSGLTRRGEVADMAVGCVFEPLLSKVHVLECVLELISQLLRLDMVVSARGLKD